MANNLYRVATIKATGKKYLVQFIDFRANKVVCWGELVSHRNLASKHEGTKAFLLDSVDIAPEAPRTLALMKELWEQSIASKREEGHIIDVRTSRRGNVKATLHHKKW